MRNHNTLRRIKEKLVFIYGEKEASSTNAKLLTLIENYQDKIPENNRHGRRCFSENDSVLITYADQVSESEAPPLKTLNDFLRRYCEGVVSSVHFLPFFPYSSDDGFSVIDYKKINPDFGNWLYVEEIGKHFGLMFDAVINHISSQSEWFKRFLDGDPQYQNYFITADPEDDLSQVFRPRSLPLLTRFETKNGPKWLWTTFSEDQIDLNPANSDTLLAIIDVLLFYAARGASLIRMDAIAYLWKKRGTTCIHLPETHAIVKLFRDVFDLVCPDVSIITETNVPHQDNISYFGENGDEAQLVYNFSLPPLTAHAILRETGEALTKWAKSLGSPGDGNTFFNFTASHDGIGVTPAKGLIDQSEIAFLCEKAKSHGGFVSTKRNSDGSDSPYELNINYFDLLKEPDESLDTGIRKFILSQAIMLAMPGVPGIYFHSLFGSRNDLNGVKQTQRPRSINRQKLVYSKLVSELEKEDSRRSQVYSRYRHLLEIRSTEPAFNPYSQTEFPELSPALFAILRTTPNGANILALNNLSRNAITLKRSELPEQLKESALVDLLTDETFPTQSDITLPAWQSMWLKAL